MKVEKYSQKQLKNLVENGVAIDVTSAHDSKVITEHYRQIGYAAGLYGCSGMLLKGDSGQLYAVTTRSQAIYLF